MLFNALIILAMVLNGANAGIMESFFKGSKPAAEASAENTDKKEEIKQETNSEENTSTSRAASVFKPVKIERQKHESSSSASALSGSNDDKAATENTSATTASSGATSVFGSSSHRTAASSQDAEHSNSRASSVFLGRKAGATKAGAVGVFGGKAQAEESSKEVTEVKEEDLKENYSGKDFLWPVEKGKVSSYYGWRSSKKFHDGIDISAPSGTKIFAVKSGKIVYSGNKISGYGNMVVVKHDTKLYTVYAHCRTTKVSKGDSVSKGQTIAEVGNTGHSHGPHLHFEVRKGKYSVDPMTYFTYLEDKKGGRKHGFVHEFK
ncbi:MAG: M23 family metallopeptidase [bacterium]